MRLVLPFPPSANRIWRAVRGRVLLSADGRAYRDAVARVVSMEARGPVHGHMDVDVMAFMPDARRRDIDNLNKAVLDAMQHAGVYQDDSQIRRLCIEHCGVDRERPRLLVTISRHITSQEG